MFTHTTLVTVYCVTHLYYNAHFNGKTTPGIIWCKEDALKTMHVILWYNIYLLLLSNLIVRHLYIYILCKSCICFWFIKCLINVEDQSEVAFSIFVPNTYMTPSCQIRFWCFWFLFIYLFFFMHFLKRVFIDVLAHCERVKPILDLVHKIISTDWTVSDCLLPLTSRIYMLLQRWRRSDSLSPSLHVARSSLRRGRGFEVYLCLFPVRCESIGNWIIIGFVFRLTSVINPPVDVIASCVNCLIVLATRQPAKVGGA